MIVLVLLSGYAYSQKNNEAIATGDYKAHCVVTFPQLKLQTEKGLSKKYLRFVQSVKNSFILNELIKYIVRGHVLLVDLGGLKIMVLEIAEEQ